MTKKEEEITRDEIIPVEIGTEMKESFIGYASTVKTDRALREVRD